MATKVKGEAIKEGSIPLSALSSEIINKLSNDKYKKLDWFYDDTCGCDIAKSQTNKIIINEKEYDLTDEPVIILLNDKKYGFLYDEYFAGGYCVIAYGSDDSDIDILTNNVFILNEASSAVTPDWNAKKGEAGYIENRPFGLVTQLEQSIRIEDDINYEDGTGIIKFKHYADFKILQQSTLGSSTTIYNDCSESNYIILFNSDYLMPEEYLSFKRKYEDGGEFIHEYEIGFTYESDDSLRNEISKALKTLTYVYDDGTEGFTKIPQSMVNMPYIDPVVWKYMLNPHVIKSGDNVPKELIGEFDEESGDRYYLKYPYLNMYLFEHDDTIFRPNEISDAGFMFEGIYAHNAHIEDIRQLWASVIIDEDKKWFLD